MAHLINVYFGCFKSFIDNLEITKQVRTVLLLAFQKHHISNIFINAYVES